MKIIVDIEEFWFDEESELTEELHNFVTNKVMNEIWKRIEGKIEKEIISQINKMVTDSLYKKSNLFIGKFLETGKIKKDVYKDGKYVKEDMTIQEFIQNKFRSDSGWGNINDHIKKIAQRFGTEMKERYDLMFASQIVARLGDNGLIKEDVAKMLLGNNKK
jgi:Zn-dependent M16 (insulinase) family peptidase